MERSRNRALIAAAVGVCFAMVASGPVPIIAPPSLDSGVVQSGMFVSLAMADDQPMERQVGGFTRTIFREIRRYYRMMNWIFWRSVDRWGRWIKMSAFSVGVAVVAALADGGLVAAWRSEGLRTLVTYSGLMLYVYGRLLFSRGVHLAPKLLLLAALFYGIVRRDLMPDRNLIPGRLDDIVLIVIATRTFVYACPERLVAEYADRAINLKRRVLALPRARGRADSM